MKIRLVRSSMLKSNKIRRNGDEGSGNKINKGKGWNVS